MFVPHRLLHRKRDHGFNPCVPVKSRYKSTCAWKQVLLWNRQVSLPFNRSLAFSRFSLLLLYTVHRCTVQEFFRFKGNFFQNVGNGRFLLVKSPKLSFGRCRPGLTGIFRRYPLFSKRSCQKKPRNVCSPLTGVTSDSWDTPAGHRVYDACRGFSVSWVCRGSGVSGASSISC